MTTCRMLSLNCMNSNGLLFAQLGLNWGSIGVILIGSAGFRWIHWFGFSVCRTPTGWNLSVGVMLFTTAVLPNKMSVSCPLQCIMFVFHLLLLRCYRPAMRTAIFQMNGTPDNMLLRQLSFVERTLLSRFLSFFLRPVWCLPVLWWVWWASCAAINC